MTYRFVDFAERFIVGFPLFVGFFGFFHAGFIHALNMAAGWDIAINTQNILFAAYLFGG